MRDDVTAQGLTRREWPVIIGLGLTIIVGYGTHYYSFGIMADAIAAEFGRSRAWIFGLFSGASFAAAFVASHAGLLADRIGAGRALVIGTLLSAAVLALLGLSPNEASFIACTVALQLLTTLVFYETAFTAVSQIAGARASRAITGVTLVGGLSSTVFWPLTVWLGQWLDWRSIYLVFAGLHLVICLPIHLYVARRPMASLTPADPADEASVAAAYRLDHGTVAPAQRRTALVCVIVGFSLGSFVLSGLLIHIVPVLEAVGLGAGAVAIGALFGPAQVFARILDLAAGRFSQPLPVTLIAAGLLPLATLILWIGSPSVAAGIAFILAFGAASGLTSIVRGSLPLALFGRIGYGERLGRLNAMRIVVAALAPFLVALLLEQFGIGAALGMSTAVGLAGLMAFLWLWRLSRA